MIGIWTETFCKHHDSEPLGKHNHKQQYHKVADLFFTGFEF